MKHNGINATRDVLKDQLALAADDKIGAAEDREMVFRQLMRIVQNPWPIRIAAVIGVALGWLLGAIL